MTAEGVRLNRRMRAEDTQAEVGCGEKQGEMGAGRPWQSSQAKERREHVQHGG